MASYLTRDETLVNTFENLERKTSEVLKELEYPTVSYANAIVHIHDVATLVKGLLVHVRAQAAAIADLSAAVEALQETFATLEALKEKS